MEWQGEFQRECSEFQINVPWGHISGKWWGPKDARPILLLHGWLDNAGTFDLLIPLLSHRFSYLAIDFPGHGLSSYLPDGISYHSPDFVYVVLKFMQAMKWDKVSILGHSLGAMVGLWLAGQFPDKIDLLIGIDGLRPPKVAPELFWNRSALITSGSLIADERNQNNDEPPAYSYRECMQRRFENGISKIDRNKVVHLLTRDIQESSKYPGKYYFRRDARLKYIDHQLWPQDIYEVLASRIRIPYLHIDALDSPTGFLANEFYSIVSRFRKNPFYELKEVHAGHFIHLETPESISDYINDFLVKYANECKKGKL